MKLTNIELTKELSQNFLDFAQEANIQRAFADARDGLKPGQRACLWEMFCKGYTSNKPHVKSAKIAGGTIASWHPHGDVAVYETFARMSQNWINNIPEVDWHGANGSIQISGEPASSRYTEARLSKASEDGLLYNIKKHNVPMKLNFSEDEEMPEVFPAILPRLMINGCQGIGSTIANVWVPHNFKELAEIIKEYIKTGKIDYSKIAPDFPTGGIIINKDELPVIYQTGKGKVILRGEVSTDKNHIYITEVPYQVYVEPFIDQIKKLISTDEIKGIDNILNKSDKKKSKLLIEIECNDDPEIVLNQLYRKTDLQKNYNVNQFALVGKTPKLLTFKEYLDIYIQHNLDCIIRENQFELGKAKDKLEITLGLIKALEDIDNIIILIKKSESSSAAIINLIDKYEFTERQAKAIVDMKLGKLARLEKVELNKLKEELTSIIKTCNNIINNKDKQEEVYLNRFNELIKKYGEDRRTRLDNIELPKESKNIEVVTPKEVKVTLTSNGMISKTEKGNGITCLTTDKLLIFTSEGKMYKLLVNDIPDHNTAISTIIKMDVTEKILKTILNSISTDNKYILFFTKNGLVKKTLLSEYISIKKDAGTTALKLKEGDNLIGVDIFTDEEVALITNNGYAIRFNTKDINPIGRIAMGVKGIKLHEGDYVIKETKITPNLNIKIPNQLRGGVGTKIN